VIESAANLLVRLHGDVHEAKRILDTLAKAGEVKSKKRAAGDVPPAALGVGICYSISPRHNLFNGSLQWQLDDGGSLGRIILVHPCPDIRGHAMANKIS